MEEEEQQFEVERGWGCGGEAEASEELSAPLTVTTLSLLTLTHLLNPQSSSSSELKRRPAAAAERRG